jgi:hypothetical protein
VLYLGLSEGGFPPLVFEEVGILCWWGLLLGLIAGVAARPRAQGAALAVLVTLLALSAWTLLAMLWSESAGRTATELARVLTYTGAFVVALLLQRGDGRAARRTLTSVAAAIAAIGLVALLSRLHPGLFGPNDLAEILPGARSRLSFPLQSWNALAALLALGLPLLLWLASSAREGWQRVAAAALAPPLVLTLYLTVSRGGALTALIALAVFTALYPIRTALLPALATTLFGGGILVAVASRMEALGDGLENSDAARQGDWLSLVVVAVMVAVGLAHRQLGGAIAAGRLPGFRRIDRRTATRAALAAAGLIVVVAIAAGAPGRLAAAYDDFRQPDTPSSEDSRLASASGNGRWQYWGAAIDAGRAKPLSGIGPGTFDFWWDREGTINGYVRDAHSLYAESFGEMGLVGLALVLALVGIVLVAGTRRTLAAAGAERAMLAAATAAAAAFALSAALDWIWEVPAVPVSFLFVSAALLCGGAEAGAPQEGEPPGRSRPVTAAWIAGAILAILAIGLPHESERAMARSRTAFSAGDYAAAYSRAERAARLQPWAGAPRLQQTLSLEAEGRLRRAALAAREAIAQELVEGRSRGPPGLGCFAHGAAP